MPKKFGAVEQNQVISKARKRRLPVQIFLKNGNIIFGKIIRYDVFCLLVKTSKANMIIYKHAISTIIPHKKKKKSKKKKEKQQKQTKKTMPTKKIITNKNSIHRYKKEQKINKKPPLGPQK
ncbi:MAG: RNA chaperone Hfq [Leptospiraceae bacterium]|nr:RNA chaperone Hfq [Leptospiraceae bacterium]MDW7977066.1 RNA chaperone Hfq [Leptospiraceae bacterium]